MKTLSKLFLILLYLFTNNLSFSQENVIKTYDLMEGHEKVLFVPGGDHFVSYGFSDTICEWDLKTGSLTKIFNTYLNWTSLIDISDPGNFVAIIAQDLVYSFFTENETIYLWDRYNSNRSYSIPQSGKKMLCIDFSSNEKNFAIGYQQGHFTVFDTLSGKIINICIPQKIESPFYESPFYLNSVYSPMDQQVLPLSCVYVLFSENGDLILSSHSDRYFRIWKTTDGSLFAYYPSDSEQFHFSNDSNTYLEYHDNKYILRESNTNIILGTFKRKSNEVLTNFSKLTSPDRKYYIKLSEETLYPELINFETDQILKTLEITQNYTRAIYSPDGKSILLGTKEDKAYLWDISDLYTSSIMRWKQSK